MIRVLFLCIHNSARSQMAEGMLRAWAGDRFEAFSAGIETAAVHPLAVQAMHEIGIDISQQLSKRSATFEGQVFDYAVTVCDDAREACPFFPGATQQVHWPFADPAAVPGSEPERLAAFRQVRDQIGEQIRGFIRSMR